MNQCLWVVLYFVGVTLIVIYIVYLCNLHSRVSRLERKASPRLEIIEREVHGIGFYLRILVGLAIFFCLCISVHYLCFCHPRLISDDAPDYMGTLVGISTIIVTLLVGWQIFSNIKERARIEKLIESNNKFRGSIDGRLKPLEDCCEKSKGEIERLLPLVNSSLNRTLMIADIQFADIYKSIILKDDDLGFEFRYLSYRIQALIRAAKLEEFSGCNIIVNDILKTLQDIPPIAMTESSKNELVKDLLEVPHFDKIIDFNRLKKVIERIKTNPKAKGL